MMIRASTSLIAAASVLAVSATALADDAALNGAAPDIRPGQSLAFDVWRGNSEFGVHEIAFSEDGEDLIAEVSVRLTAGVGPLTVFRYEHESTERWRDGQLIQIYGSTLKDGDRFPIEGAAENGAMIVEGVSPEGEAVTTEFPLDIIPSSHWRGYPGDVSEILYTEHGDAMPVSLEYIGEEEIEADGGTITARKYRLDGTLTSYLWYDADGHWAGCEFEARGQHIRYVRRASPA